VRLRVFGAGVNPPVPITVFNGNNKPPNNIVEEEDNHENHESGDNIDDKDELADIVDIDEELNFIVSILINS
jgi:hypothetical protein